MKEEPREEKPDRTREKNVDWGPPPQHQAGVLGRHKYCHRNRRSLLRIVPKKILVLTSVLLVTSLL